MNHPYKDLPDTQFWSRGVKVPVSTQQQLEIEPLVDSLQNDDSIASGGSCFAQYIGKELTSRDFNYLRSTLSGDRVESFGLGNIYTITQLRQWLEFSLGKRNWGDDCVVEKDGLWQDLLLPHLTARSSRAALEAHRNAIKDEILAYLGVANVLIFTLGLTETWRNQHGDVFPTCPGTMAGEFNAAMHHFHNCTVEDVYQDLIAVENLLKHINQDIRVVYTVSPVPLTATASEDHVLVATTYSKSVLRAAVGQFTRESSHATYFPSFELISHHADNDWRFKENLRSISDAGVRYVMGHAFGHKRTEPPGIGKSARPGSDDHTQEAACEEQLLESYSRLTDSPSALGNSDIVLVGDCHLEKLANGFRNAGVEVTGGIVMHGSSFTDYKFELSADRIFNPLDSAESEAIWSDIHGKLIALQGDCHIITNIGFHTHRTINRISNHLAKLVLTEVDIAAYFEEFYSSQVYILRELTRLGKVWMVEDPDFHAFIGNKNNSQIVRDKNFHPYCHYMRSIAGQLGIEYLSPCDKALQNLFSDSVGLRDILAPEGFLGQQIYYDYCATVVNDNIGSHRNALSRAA